MNRSEALALLRMVKAVCPSQQIDQYTPDAWHMALDDITPADALAAVRKLSRRELEPGQSNYIEPGHIRGEVRKIRSRRHAKHPVVDPPLELSAIADLPALIRVEHAFRAEVNNRIGDGENITAEVAAEIGRRLMAELAPGAKRLELAAVEPITHDEWKQRRALEGRTDERESA